MDYNGINFEKGYINNGEYILYSEEELAEKEQEKLLESYRQQLSDLDYEALKYAEGYFTEEEYAPIKKTREELREKIRAIIDN